MKPIKAGIDSKKKLIKRIKPKKFIQRPAGKSGPVEKIRAPEAETVQAFA